MEPITRKYLKDDDINIQRVERRLLELSHSIRESNRNNLTDINVICEEVFGRILNKLYNIELVSMSAEVSGNYVAVDLIDYNNRVAYQVTSQSKREKIKSTIDKFNRSELYKEIDELNFLVLDSREHNYREQKISLKSGSIFSFSKNILDFKKLVNEIENKDVEGFIVEVYDIINMAYDSGRLKYVSVVRETEELMKNASYESVETKSWIKGYGDIQLSAFIPLSYETELSCMLQFRQNDVSGALITFDQDTLLNDYFVSEEEFEAKHNVGRYENEEEMYMQIQNLRIRLNAHTAYHIYKLFEELKEEFFRAKIRIEDMLGATGLPGTGNSYLIKILDKIEWEEILFFARNHDWFLEDGELEWNIFQNSWCDNCLNLHPNAHESIKGTILAQLYVEKLEGNHNKLKLYWRPGFQDIGNSMENFDNIVKWKADYTKEWIETKLLGKAHNYYKEYNYNPPFWRRIFRFAKQNKRL